MLGVALVTALGWGASCGGNVVVDPVGEGGAGAAGSTTVGPVSSSSTSGGTDPEAQCARFCELSDAYGCSDADCMSSCRDAYVTAGDCSAELTAFIACVSDTLGPGCSLEDQCLELLDDYDACLFNGAGCDGEGCFLGENGDCGCSGFCSGSEVATQCSMSSSSGVYDCVCIIEGSVIATCQGTGNACDLKEGCCSVYF